MSASRSSHCSRQREHSCRSSSPGPGSPVAQLEQLDVLSAELEATNAKLVAPGDACA